MNYEQNHEEGGNIFVNRLTDEFLSLIGEIYS